MELIDLKKYIDNQFESNKLKNIFSKIKRNVRFNKEIQELIDEDRIKLIDILTIEQNKVVIKKYLVEKFKKWLFEINKYSRLSTQELIRLYDIYELLIKDIEDKNLNSEQIEEMHYSRIKEYIIKTNLFIFEENKNGGEIVKDIIYSEYTPKFQLDILKIDINNLKGKVLDIGCGKSGQLVNYLRKNSVDAFGIDRECEDSKYLKKVDWLEYDYKKNYYQTIISNISFTSHFLNNKKRMDTDFLEYAKVYMKILNSLKINGKWHYAPALPFIEELLPEEEYEVRNSFVDEDNMNTVITKIKEVKK